MEAPKQLSLEEIFQSNLPPEEKAAEYWRLLEAYNSIPEALEKNPLLVGRLMNLVPKLVREIQTLKTGKDD